MRLDHLGSYALLASMIQAHLANKLKSSKPLIVHALSDTNSSLSLQVVDPDQNDLYL